ncbi:MAG: hypothetical protein KatS3mg051_2083 [Anaerolineae bacterium]|nr:MAG: hypothetical protein KatS3mg051_2083 [Anaerolineae bacterium]
MRDLPVPEDIADLFAEVRLHEFAAAALVKLFIARYGGMEGTGLFEGMERYRRLEERLQQSAVQAGTLLAWWGLLCRSMQVPGTVGEVAPVALRLLTLPSALGQRVLRVMAETPAPVVMLGRLWAEQERLQSEAYAEKAGMEAAAPGRVTLTYRASDLVRADGTVTLEIPQYSANALRHELVREPLLWHLYQRLGIAFDEPLASRTALHYNGGDLKRAGSAGVFWLRKTIRETYPHLALLSGSTDTFLLGESNLRIHCWLRCRENSEALAHAGLQTDVSAFDLLDRETLTRHAGRLGGHESVQTAMPFTFETLMPGAEIVARLALTPYAQDLEEGALAVAVQMFQMLDLTLGGQSARGYGLVEPEWVDGEPRHADDYEAYVIEHAERLRAGILDGTLGTEREVITE